jgi:hypothetical protein
MSGAFADGYFPGRGSAVGRASIERCCVLEPLARKVSMI